MAILFWDKNIAKSIPLALRMLLAPGNIEYYLQHFPLSDMYLEGGDDKWLNLVDGLGWTVITQDYHLHTKQNELYAIKQYEIGCFYLWGSEASKWEVMRCFARAYDRIMQAISSTPRPFIFTVTRTGLLRRVHIS